MDAYQALEEYSEYFRKQFFVGTHKKDWLFRLNKNTVTFGRNRNTFSFTVVSNMLLVNAPHLHLLYDFLRERGIDAILYSIHPSENGVFHYTGVNSFHFASLLQSVRYHFSVDATHSFTIKHPSCTTLLTLIPEMKDGVASFKAMDGNQYFTHITHENLNDISDTFNKLKRETVLIEGHFKKETRGFHFAEAPSFSHVVLKKGKPVISLTFMGRTFKDEP